MFNPAQKAGINRCLTGIGYSEHAKPDLMFLIRNVWDTIPPIFGLWGFQAERNPVEADQ